MNEYFPQSAENRFHTDLKKRRENPAAIVSYLIAAAIRIAGRNGSAVCTGVKAVAVADCITVVKTVAVCPATGMIRAAACIAATVAVIVRAAACVAAAVAVIVRAAACVAAARAVIIIAGA